MNRLYTSGDFSSSCSSDTDDGSSSEDEGTANMFSKKQRIAEKKNDSNSSLRKSTSQNIIFKLQNRERSGYFTDKISHKDRKLAFVRVPRRLQFCLKEIVPYCYLTGHVFMGLTICGQFMLSYKIISDEDSALNNYSFTSTYKYELYFWIYRPHNLLYKYFTICLFDDHGVDNIKTVTMAQWKTNPRVLVIHGGGGCESEDSYISVVAVPNLGCLDCKKLRDEFCADTMDVNRSGYLCIKCNFTIHTKYCRADTDPVFNPSVNLQCLDKILIMANGLIHMIHIDLHMNKQVKPFTNTIDIKYVKTRTKSKPDTSQSDEVNKDLVSLPNGSTTISKCSEQQSTKTAKDRPNSTLNGDDHHHPPPPPPSSQHHQLHHYHLHHHHQQQTTAKSHEPKNIVEKIIADFAECETDIVPTEKQQDQSSRITSNAQSNFNELVITCRNNIDKPLKQSTSSTKVRLLNHRSNRIISKSVANTMKNTITKVDFGTSPTTNATISSGSSNNLNKNLDKAAKAYEFSEDNEKCEKISTFRKRRLADKKYEFSEDNTENIIPYNRMRSVIRNPALHQKISRHSPAHSNVVNYSSSPPSTFEMPTSYHTHRASPSYGFRSPCGSPVGNRFHMMSPPARSCFNAKSPSCTRSATMSPRSLQNMKRPYYDSMLDPHSNLILSPRSDDCDSNKTHTGITNFPLSEVKPSNIDLRSSQQNICERSLVESDQKPQCSIILIRHYVEEDDAASVITSEEDDCISPGYHTSLPLEVHGAGYSDMQMISKNSYKKLMCPTLIVTQITFDLEAFTYYAVNYLCSINNKKYGFFFDCGCEIVKICPLSCALTCILMVNFTASDMQLDPSVNNCLNCSSNLNLDCVFHRKHYECQILFTWDIETGEWNVLDYGHLMEVPPILTSEKHTPYIHRIVSKLAADMISGLSAYTDIFNQLHVLDSCVEKSKKILRDVDNSIEFYRTTAQIRYSSDLSDIEME
ncbi:uncharacterized protein LOC116347070 isoform X2 [Contarinia nasturtii]|uniref:uncharacterized protein LOC116347070 isoform X2 n=1 Tax=Contarinia nasturtii TaxID=265458 RepID=UPI0012D373FA|nr:uncharacterized protein LOC116347070 isoform X2 [Contarinia nasturtii]